MSAPTAEYVEQHHKVACISAIILSSIGLLFLCVGIGTSSWHIDYDLTGITHQWYTSYFFTCYALNGTCWNNQYLSSSVVNYYEQPLTSLAPVSTDYYLRLRNAAALGIIGLLFVSFGLVAAIFLSLRSKQFQKYSGHLHLFTAILFAVAALFQRAALSEGARAFSVNGYSGNLYQTGHALTIAAIPVYAFVAARIYL